MEGTAMNQLLLKGRRKKSEATWNQLDLKDQLILERDLAIQRCEVPLLLHYSKPSINQSMPCRT